MLHISLLTEWHKKMQKCEQIDGSSEQLWFQIVDKKRQNQQNKTNRFFLKMTFALKCWANVHLEQSVRKTRSNCGAGFSIPWWEQLWFGIVLHKKKEAAAGWPHCAESDFALHNKHQQNIVILAKNQQLSNVMPMGSTVADTPTWATNFYSTCY